jgi:hypothetical protein
MPLRRRHRHRRYLQPIKLTSEKKVTVRQKKKILAKKKKKEKKFLEREKKKNVSNFINSQVNVSSCLWSP